MTDRELLELSALAIGRRIAGWNTRNEELVAVMDDGSFWQPLLENHITDCMGDALRLASVLRMRLEIAEYYAIALHPETGACCRENTTMGYGIDEATCRAITRAAAEVGKAMKEAPQC